jgi:uncharacterized protein (DUF1684 family)
MDVEAATKETESWREKHETDYRRDWVTIAGLHFLEPGSHSAGSADSNDIELPASAPAVLGSFVLAHDVVRFEPQTGSAVSLNGKPVTSPVDLVDDSAPKADELVAGDVRVVVHRSGERKSLRVWDPNGELARGFLGFTWFPIQMDYRVTGRFIPDATSRTMQVMNTFGDLDTYKTEADRRSGCARLRRGQSVSILCFAMRRADRRPTRPLDSSTQIFAMMERRCWTSIRRTTHHVRSIRSPRARFRCRRIVWG